MPPASRAARHATRCVTILVACDDDCFGLGPRHLDRCDLVEDHMARGSARAISTQINEMVPKLGSFGTCT
jgi:hypothetical protein